MVWVTLKPAVQELEGAILVQLVHIAHSQSKQHLRICGVCAVGSMKSGDCLQARTNDIFHQSPPLSRVHWDRTHTFNHASELSSTAAHSTGMSVRPSLGANATTTSM